jgi:hypothetical protein
VGLQPPHATRAVSEMMLTEGIPGRYELPERGSWCCRPCSRSLTASVVDRTFIAPDIHGVSPRRIRDGARPNVGLGLSERRLRQRSRSSRLKSDRRGGNFGSARHISSPYRSETTLGCARQLAGRLSMARNQMPAGAGDLRASEKRQQSPPGRRAGAQCLGDMPWLSRATAIGPDACHVVSARTKSRWAAREIDRSIPSGRASRFSRPRRTVGERPHHYDQSDAPHGPGQGQSYRALRRFICSTSSARAG